MAQVPGQPVLADFVQRGMRALKLSGAVDGLVLHFLLNPHAPSAPLLGKSKFIASGRLLLKLTISHITLGNSLFF